ncbi:MAG: amidohydrolase [Henriciella sp.]|nr:amidohydrolase [Henriciella sp.]
MRRSLVALCGLAVSACVQSGDEAPTPSGADSRPVAATVFSGGTIYTGNGAQTVDAVAVGAEGRILWTGSSADLEAEIDVSNAVFEALDDAFMYPGFTDAHIHLLGIGQRELSLDLADVGSVADLVDRIEAEVADAGPGAVIFGRGWIETGWPEGRMPLASDLDTVAPDNPVILIRADGHALVANSAALEAAGIDDTTPDVEGGKIERDANGRATGILIDNSMAAVTALIAAPTESDLIAAYAVGAAEYVSRGWTGGHNMSVSPEHAALLERLDVEGRLPLRLHNNFDQAGAHIAADRLHETDTITNRSVKLYMDGALGSRGALLIEPYADRPGTSGLSLMDPDALGAFMQLADERDIQLAIHAIGDLANRRILDVFEAGAFGADQRWRIEHTQILHPDDIDRVAHLGLLASMQPSHAIGDLKFAPARLGMRRLRGAYAWNSLLEAGALVVGGSDAPVEVGSPLIEFYAAVARKDLEGFSAEGWHLEEALTREQALALFTSAPAYAAFMEEDLGTIETGKIADFTVFDRDLMTVDEADILNAQTVMTVVQGEIVHRKD